jgi:Phosphotransferase enzyme family
VGKLRVLTNSSEVSPEWLSKTLQRPVIRVETQTEASNWATQVPLRAYFADGSTQALRLKICLGETFGRSEVDYYTRDYVALADAPLVRCYDAQFAPGVGYHLLLEDLSETHHNRRDAPPTLAYGLAVAEALGRLHRHHSMSQPVPDNAVWERYFAEIRPGVLPLEKATGQAFSERFAAHAAALRQRWADPLGQSLLHGDLNSTNVLTPKNAESPVYFLDRQPFDWSLTYGLAAYDLAYFLIHWWPEEARQEHEAAIVCCWWEAFAQPGYTWEQAQADWGLSVEQCLHVPLEWCSKPETIETMRWLWSFQLARVQAAQSSS